MNKTMITLLRTLQHRTAILALLMFPLSTSVAFAVPVTTWRTFRGTDSTPTVIESGQGTNDPVIGNTTTTAASTRIIGYFEPITLVNEGDSISLTYTVSFNDAV